MDAPLRKTPLDAEHRRLGAKMVPFAGFEMPIQFVGIVAEHKAVRSAWGVFDVSHMGEIDFLGPDAVRAVDTVVTHDVSQLQDHQALYTMVCRGDGGIVDDCIVYRLGAEHLRIVVNAANVAKDDAHFRAHAGSMCSIENVSETYALLAVQGPHAVEALSDLFEHPTLADAPSFGLTFLDPDRSMLAARTGYTGEDGFELFVPVERAVEVWRRIIDRGAQPVGLGARDTLRLEARLSLYGQDLTESTNPYEAGLGWTVKLDKSTPFVGQAALRQVKADGASRKLVGFVVKSRGIARAGAEVLSDTGDVVGQVTSGGPSPTLGGAIGLAYVPTELAGPGRPLRIRQRSSVLDAEQVSGPFYRRST